MESWKVSVCGCSLADNLYTIDFNSEALRNYMSQRDGDGGISPGKLVFAEDLELFSGVEYNEIAKIFSADGPIARNLGGPAIVGAINAAQLLYDQNVKFEFHGYRGNDESGKFIENIVSKTPLDVSNYLELEGATPVTDVLSDPAYHDGKGERSFINRIGISNEFEPEDLGASFFEGDILWFAATALVPRLHDNIDLLLEKGRQLGKINIVSTVYDFRNEKVDPVGAWPLGKCAEKTYPLIDLLILDCEEALRMSGTRDLIEASAFLMESGVSSFFITHGAKEFFGWSDGRLFEEFPLAAFPVCSLVDEELAKHPERRGDTTGCGDNFAGGLVGALVKQLIDGVHLGELGIHNVAAWAAASGGAACFYYGGTYLESEPGEKRAFIEPFVMHSLAEMLK